MEPLVPDYAGANVCGLVPALVGDRAVAWMPGVVEGARHVVLLLLDGLGWEAIEEHPDRVPTLRGMDGAAITTVAPSTTSAALTSVLTGLPPAVHGMTGYRMLVGEHVLNTLRWVDGARRPPPDPFDVQRHDAFLGRPVPVVSKSEFRDSGFTRAHMRGAPFVGWSTTATLVEHCRRLVGAGERLVYAYYPGVDTVAHEFGLRDAFYEAELSAADALVAALLDALPADTALLVTADHGQVHLEPDSWVDLGDLAPLVAVQAGDGRFRYLYARDGARSDLLSGARERFGGVAWVRSRREVLAEGWLGAGPSGSIPGRIGDVVLAARDPVAFVDPSVPFERRLRSGHGSLTTAEMLVPLLGARGNA